MRRLLCLTVVLAAMLAGCGDRIPCDCPPRDPATGHAFDTAAFDFVQDDPNARRGSIETDPTHAVVTYQTEDGRMFRAIYEKRGHAIETR